MPTYISLLNLTQKGIESIKDGPSRLDAAKAAFRAAGAEMKAYYLTMGRYDAIAIIEAPDDQTLAKLSLTIGSRGFIRTETLRAFPEDDYRRIISGLP